MSGLKYQVHRNHSGGVRYDIMNLPEVGAVLKLATGETVRFDGPGMAGLLMCTDNQGYQMLYWPSQFEGASKEQP